MIGRLIQDNKDKCQNFDVIDGNRQELSKCSFKTYYDYIIYESRHQSA